MKLKRSFWAAAFAIVASCLVSTAARAVVPSDASPLLRRAIELYSTLTLPTATSLDQRRYLSVTCAAAELGSTDMEAFMQAFGQAGAFVVYQLQSDTIYYFDDTPPPGTWVLNQRTTYSYSSGNLVERVRQGYHVNSATWNNQTRISNTYSAGRLSTTTSQTWESDAWDNNTRTTYSYDGNGSQTEVLTETWTGAAWENVYRITTTYVGLKADVTTNQNWVGGAWVNSTRTTTTWSGDLVASAITDSWFGSVWIPTYRTTFTYTGVRVATMINETSFNGVSWTNFSKNEFTYDGASNNQTLSTYSTWVANAWSLYLADTTRYSSGRAIERVTYIASPYDLTRHIFTYDGSDNMITDLRQQYIAPDWVNSARTENVYIVAGIFDGDEAAAVPSNFSLAQNYPNPFNQSTLIPYSLAGDSHVRITVANILGQTVSTVVDDFQASGSHTATWDGRDGNSRDVASGIYFFRIQVGNASQVRKMVLLK